MKKLINATLIIILLSFTLISCEDLIPGVEDCNCGTIVNTWNENYQPYYSPNDPNTYMVEFDINVRNYCTNELDTFHVVRFNSWVYVNTEYCVPTNI